MGTIDTDKYVAMGKDRPRPRRRVIFSAPPGMKGAQRLSGTIVKHTPKRGRLFSRGSWGQYLFVAQWIRWDHKWGHKPWVSIRIVYYRRNAPGDRWRFASQTTVNAEPRIMKAICRDILRTTWR